MSGTCYDCGNNPCVCDLVAEDEAGRRRSAMSDQPCPHCGKFDKLIGPRCECHEDERGRSLVGAEGSALFTTFWTVGSWGDTRDHSTIDSALEDIRDHLLDGSRSVSVLRWDKPIVGGQPSAPVGTSELVRRCLKHCPFLKKDGEPFFSKL